VTFLYGRENIGRWLVKVCDELSEILKMWGICLRYRF
jgi:hypothetical protein